MPDDNIHAAITDDQFDLDIRVRVVSRAVDKFVLADTDSCASTCGGECTNSCASTCEGGCTDTCSTCGSCTSECAFGDTGAACQEVDLFEDRYIVEIGRVGVDGVTRKVAGENVVRRVQRR